MIELVSDAPLARDLAAGGVFVPGCALRMDDECDLVVCGANRRISVPARVVYVDEGAGGTGLELIGFSTEMRDQLAELEPIGRSLTPDEDDLAVPVASLPGDDDRTSPVTTGVHEAPDDDLAVPLAADDGDDHLTIPISTGVHPAAGVEPAPPVASDGLPMQSDPAIDPTGGAAPRPAGGAVGVPTPRDRASPIAIAEADAASGGAADPESAPAAEDAGDGFEDAAAGHAPESDAVPEATEATEAPELDEAGDRPGEPHAPRNVHERLRGLPLAAQIKLAAAGELHERIVLERLYGKNVWETLLRNPRLTPPEVSRIARYGSLPRVLLEIILASNAWLAVPEVRRALLSNPRLPTDQIMKILRLVPRHELRLAAIQTAYPQAVRSAARVLLGNE
ncbi:MAG TPA: hypothetical protein VF469_08645 [Kofleriaceae bacterium]